MERLHILDGHNHIFRAFFGMAGVKGRGVRLATSQGMPTGALYVYSSMLIALHRDVKPERIVVVFDAPGPTFRDELDDGYKATRREMPDDLKPQMPYFEQVTRALAWPTLSIPGVEADDVIATLVTHARARGWDAVVYSSDKDLMQLVDGHVEIVDAVRGLRYDAARVQEKFGVAPAQMRDYLALVGDSSDNVPGMPGIGPKHAVKLLAAYGSIDELLARVDELGGKQRESFRDPAKRAQLELSRQLVTLRHDVELGVDLDALRSRPWDAEQLTALFEKLEFQALLARLGPAHGDAQVKNEAEAKDDAEAGSDAVAAASPERAAKISAQDLPEPVIATAAQDLEPLVAAARQARILAVQVESDGARPDRARLIGLSLAAPDTRPVYVPLGHRYLGAPAQLTVATLPADLCALLADPAIAVVCHDAKTVRRMLTELGVELAGVAGDIMLAAYLLDPDHDLSVEGVLAMALGVSLPGRKGLLGKGKTRIEFESVAIDAAAACSARATHATLAAHAELERRLREARLHELLHQLELPLALMLADVERAGICLDVPYLAELSAQVGADIAALEQRVRALAGVEINLGSPKQLSELLFEHLGLKSEKMRKTKLGYSTDHEVLESLVDDHEIVALVIEHRELVKLKGTYLDALPPLVNSRTGRIHTTFNQAVAATGRLSSQDPNLQNIPIRTELGRRIRRAFVAAEGTILVSADYSQIELRILAHLSRDPVLVHAFQNNIDVHTQTAAEVFGIPLDQVGADERRVAKAVNYGLVYGQSQFGLARALGIPRSEARVYITRYFERFARVAEFLDGVVEAARRTGMVETVLGRRRRLADLQSRHFQRRQAAERMAKNTPMQGSAADIMKLAMLKVARRLEREPLDASMLLTVHDELVFEVAPDQAQALSAVVVEEMESAYQLEVPLVATVGSARTWADAH